MRYLFVIVCLLIFYITSAQVNSTDSSLWSEDLSTVTILDDGSINDKEFSFYRSNKLANTEELLARMKGVNLIKRGAYGLEPTLRSYGSGQTNLTIDGMRIYGACTDKMDPVSIYVEPANLGAINVVQGAGGALAGSTVGGQIDMVLKEPAFTQSKNQLFKLSQSYGSVNNGVNSSIWVQKTQQKFAYRLSGVYRKANDYKAANNMSIPYSGYEKVNLNGVVKYKLDSFQTVKFDYLGDWGRNIGYPALPMDAGYANAQILAITHRMHGRSKWLDNNELKLYFNAVYHSMDDTHRENIPMHMDMPGWSQTIGFYNKLTSKKDWNFRLDFHRVNARAEMTMYPNNEAIMYLQTLPENNLSNLGMAFSKAFKFKNKQSIQINGRVDAFNQSALASVGAKQWEVFDVAITENKINVLKNLSLLYVKKLWAKSSIQMRASFGERLPTSNERYGFYLYNRQDQFDYLGNLALKPENSVQSELTFKQRFKKIKYEVNLFYHHTSNFIYAYKLSDLSQMTIGAKGVKTYKNIDFATSKGFELLANVQIFKDLEYMMAAKFVFSETYLNTPLPLVPPLKIQQALRYRIKQYTMQAEYDWAMEQKRLNVDYGDVYTSGFSLLNLRISRFVELKTKSVQLGFACENVFDVYYREHLDIGQIPRFGRNFLLNVSMLF